MRRWGFVALVLALTAAQSPALWAADEGRSYSLINAGAARIDFADEHAQMGKNGFVTFNILTVMPAGPVAYTLSQVSLNCSSSQLATVSTANYSPDNVLLPSEVVDMAAQPISPGTLGQALHGVICNGTDPYPRSKPVKGVAAAVSKAHDLFAALKASK